MKASDRRLLAQLGSPAPDAQVAAAIAEQKATARDLEERADRVDALVRQIASLREDLVRSRWQHDALTAVGDDKLTIPRSTYDDRFRLVVEWQPIESVHTGAELAARVQEKIDETERQIAAREAEIENLLAEPKTKRRRFRFREPAAS